MTDRVAVVQIDEAELVLRILAYLRAAEPAPEEPSAREQLNILRAIAEQTGNAEVLACLHASTHIAHLAMEWLMGRVNQAAREQGFGDDFATKVPPPEALQ
jgi:hypothetical protein